MESMSADNVILRVLQETRNQCARPIYRTALVKLVYLVDYVYAQHTGRTLTGFQYVWDDHGPNAVGNEIVKRADWQSLKGMIQVETGLTPSGNPKYLYRLVGEADVSVDELGEQIIRDVTMTYGSLNWSAIVKAAKETKPILKAKPGDSLDLAPEPEKQRRLAKVAAEVGHRDYETDRRGVSIGELKTRYRLSN